MVFLIFFGQAEAISILIQQVTGITYGSRHVRKLLDEWGIAVRSLYTKHMNSRQRT
ncbi:MAG: winged helix-turn-helix domain-containing protein [Saprospiraceae bacterium]|nr:winged helix-turn-helix domain-containing protein [Saprospiraceae bacterium]